MTRWRGAPLLVALVLLPSTAMAQEGDWPWTSELENATTLELGVDMQLFRRHLRYRDDLNGYLRPYDLNAGPSIAMHGRWYPGGQAAPVWARAIGVEASYARSFGIVSERLGGTRFPTTNQMADVNLLGRYLIGRHALIGRFGFGSHRFALDLDQPSRPPGGLAIPDVPSVGYRFLRYGVEGRIAIMKSFGAIVGASFLQVLDAGGLQDEVWFPRATGNGAELGVAAVLALHRGFELRLSIDYRRYFFSMNPEVGDVLVAGGGLDQYIFMSAGFVYRL